jgi:hypothetical protein
MRFDVIGIGEFKGFCIYDEDEDALIYNKKVVLNFKKDYEEYLKYTKFMINTDKKRAWISFQFIPKEYEFLRRRFAIITAYNPKHMIFNDFTNFLRNSELQKDIVKLGYEHYLSIGELFYYSERSFIIFDITKKEALELGRKYNQHSIFFNSGEYISITECDSKKDILKYNYKKHFKG